MPRVKKLDLGMTALDELFMNDKERAENKLPKIFDIPLSEIDDFPDHPYRVLDDEDMQNLMESIRDRGVITPAMVRKKDHGRYEMISGHRRKHASERLGLETLRCEVVEVSRDEAIILMVDSNAQRSEILPCDKGRAYKMKLDAIKRLPGRPSKENGVPVGHHLEGKSREILAEKSEDSNTQIQRYTLTATLTDKAGNTTEKTITFSANRFGSTYGFEKATEILNGSYVQKAEDVVVTETNANELKNIKITLFKNSETIVLKEGVDFKIDVKGGNGQWYEYTYTVFAKNFADDGVYRLTFHSEDAAGNIAENTLDTKDMEIGFGVDKTKPNVVVTNLESGKTYPLEKLAVSMSANDNLLLKSVVVYLDNYDKEYKSWNAEEIAEIIANKGEFTFDVSGESTSAHKVKVVCTDAAGNEQVEEITDFYVTTNLWVRYYTNKPLFFGSIGGVILIAGLAVALVVIKKKKKQA